MSFNRIGRIAFWWAGLSRTTRRQEARRTASRPRAVVRGRLLIRPVLLGVGLGVILTLGALRMSPLTQGVHAVAGTATFSGGSGEFTGDLTAARLLDQANTAYLIDPAASGTSLATAGTATIAGTLTLGNAAVFRPAFGPLSFQYKSGLDAWTTGLTIQDTTGNVGIGTTGPNAKLDVQTTSSGTQRLLNLVVPNVSGNNGELAFQVSPNIDVAKIQALYTSSGHVELAFSAYNNGIGEVMRLKDGNVGIGTTGPNFGLDIKNDLRVQTGYRIYWGGTGAADAKGSIYMNSTVPTFADYVSGSWKDSISLNNGNVGIGTTTPSTALHVIGTITGTTKNFEIDHPTKSGMKLVHSTLEGPEVAVFYRGEARLTNGKAVVVLPEYFEALTRKGGRTVQLTAKNGWSPLYVDGEVVNGRFAVKADSGKQNQEFFWEVKAVRADVEPLVVEKPSKNF